MWGSKKHILIYLKTHLNVCKQGSLLESQFARYGNKDLQEKTSYIKIIWWESRGFNSVTYAQDVNGKKKQLSMEFCENMTENNYLYSFKAVDLIKTKF